MSVSPFICSLDWDTIQIGGVRCPGIFKFTDVPKRSYEWDKKKGKGTKGETKTFVQMPASEGKGKFYLWRDEHFVAWESFRGLLRYDPSKTVVTAIEIYHPACADIELHSVVTEYLGAVHHEGKLLFSIEWAFGEFFPAERASVTSTATDSKQWEHETSRTKDGTQTLDDENANLSKQAADEGAI
jgi:hypothetical protein